MLEPDVQRDETTERRPANRGVSGLGPRPERPVDPRLQFVDHEAGVVIGVAARMAMDVARGCELVGPLGAGMVDGHDDQRRDAAVVHQSLGRLVDAPFDARKRGARVEDVLAVVQVQHRVTAPVIVLVARRQVHEDVAAVAERVRVEGLEQPDVAGEAPPVARRVDALGGAWGHGYACHRDGSGRRIISPSVTGARRQGRASQVACRTEARSPDAAPNPPREMRAARRKRTDPQMALINPGKNAPRSHSPTSTAPPMRSPTTRGGRWSSTSTRRTTHRGAPREACGFEEPCPGSPTTSRSSRPAGASPWTASPTRPGPTWCGWISRSEVWPIPSCRTVSISRTSLGWSSTHRRRCGLTPALWGVRRGVMEEPIALQTRAVNKADAPQGYGGGRQGRRLRLPPDQRRRHPGHERPAGARRRRVARACFLHRRRTRLRRRRLHPARHREDGRQRAGQPERPRRVRPSRRAGGRDPAAAAAYRRRRPDTGGGPSAASASASRTTSSRPGTI